MSEIVLHSNSANSATLVPNTFIDRYMIEANGEYVKVFLYLLRHSGNTDVSISISSIAGNLEHTQKDIKKALCYWEKTGLLLLERDFSGQICGVAFNHTSTLPISEEIDIHSEQEEDFYIETETPNITPISNIEQLNTPMIPVDPKLEELCWMAEKLMNKSLSATDIQAFIFWHDSLGHSWDLIEYIIDYCTGNGHPNISYMNAVAKGFADNNISSVEEAKLSSKQHSSLSREVQSAFGLTKRELTKIELEYINKWHKDYGFSEELITIACQRTIMTINTPSFPYADSILTDWHKRNVVSPDDLEAIDAAFKSQKTKVKPSPKPVTNKFHNFSTRGMDYTNLEKKLTQA